MKNIEKIIVKTEQKMNTFMKCICNSRIGHWNIKNG